MAGGIRLLRIAAAVLMLHGLLLLVAGGIQWLFPDRSLEAIGEAVFVVLVLPALLLTWPFMPLLWQLHLMNAPGWFAWPKPLGIALAYVAWIAALLALARVLQVVQRRRGSAAG